MTYHFDAELAVKIGVEEAVMMNNMAFWIQHNIANNKHLYEGRYWTYNTVQAFAELYPFWTVKQLRRIMESLYSQKVLIKGNFNKKSFDRTGWYSITDEYAYLLHLPKQANGEPKTANGNAQKGNTIPNEKTDNSLFNNNEGKIKSNFKIPPLEEVQEYFRLLKKENCAARFYDHFTSNGWMVGRVKMKDWKAAVRNWIAKGEEEPGQQKSKQAKPGVLNGIDDMLQHYNDI